MNHASLTFVLVAALVVSGCRADVHLGDGLEDPTRVVEHDSGPPSTIDSGVVPIGDSSSVDASRRIDVNGKDCGKIACSGCLLGTRRVADGTCCGLCVPIAGSVCGDGLLESSEVCDDGNTTSGDGCSLDCTFIEPRYLCPQPGAPCHPLDSCGNGLVETARGEECDDGVNNGSPGTCSASCKRVPPLCDMKCAPCDPNSTHVDDGSCCGQCVAIPPRRCGDSLIDAFEECDDGNVVDNDGCSSRCAVEAGYSCLSGIDRPTHDSACTKLAPCLIGSATNCNDDPEWPSPLGICAPATNTCVCNPGAGIRRVTGRCVDCSIIGCAGCPEGTRRVADDTCCGSCLEIRD